MDLPGGLLQPPADITIRFTLWMTAIRSSIRNAAGATDMRTIITLALLALTLSACAGGPTALTHVKYRGCVNHDIHDFHGSNAQQDC
jgi:hypothetical protein